MRTTCPEASRFASIGRPLTLGSVGDWPGLWNNDKTGHTMVIANGY
jgi:hypothetical protein